MQTEDGEQETLVERIAGALDAWFIEHDGDEIDTSALARIAIEAMEQRVNVLENEREWLLERLSVAWNQEIVGPDGHGLEYDMRAALKEQP